MQMLIENVSWINGGWKGCVIAFLIVLFLFFYKKQTNIVKRCTEAINSQQEAGEKDSEYFEF